MTTKKLIPMVQFIIERAENAPIEEFNEVNEHFVNDVISYANFLNQPITIDSFVGENSFFQDFEIKEVVNDSVFSKTIEHKSGVVNVFWFETATQKWLASHGLKRVEDAVRFGFFYSEP